MGIAAAETQIVSSVVCDASVLFKLVVSEPDSDKAATLVRSVDVFVPEFIFLEIGNGLWSRVARGDLDAAEAARLMADFVGIRFQVRSIGGLVQRALALATMVKHPIYDFGYLVLAEALDVPLVTADQRFLNALHKANVDSVELRSLADFS
jgi:predicted nucleic acid-binding protein